VEILKFLWQRRKKKRQPVGRDRRGFLGFNLAKEGGWIISNPTTGCNGSRSARHSDVREKKKSLIVMLQRIDAMYKEDATEIGAGAKFASKKNNATVAHLLAQQDSDGMDLVALHVTAGPSEEARRMQTNSQRLFRQDAGVFGLSRLTPKRVTGRNCILLGPCLRMQLLPVTRSFWYRAGGSGIRTGMSVFAIGLCYRSCSFCLLWRSRYSSIFRCVCLTEARKTSKSFTFNPCTTPFKPCKP
jgi:hypothetical protein